MKSKNFLWLSLPLFILLIIAFLKPITPNDYWWYLRLGSDILTERAIPTVDTFTQTQAGQPMVYHSWLSALLLYWVYKIGGLPLTFLLRGLVLALTYALLWKIIQKRGASPQLASLITFFVVLTSSLNWAMRPQLLVYPLFVWTMWITLGWDEAESDTKILAWLPLISLLWTNLHGSFVLLFPLVGAALLFGRGEKKQLFIMLGAATIATLLNPRGIGVWIYVKDSLTVVSNQAYSREWMPPINEGWQMNLFFGWILLYLTVASRNPRAVSKLGAVWMLGFGWLAFAGLRYGIWFLFILAIFTAEMLKEWLKKSPRRGIPKMDYAIGALLLLFPLALLPGIREAWWGSAPKPLSADTPVDAVEWLQGHPELRPLWADLAYSSYLVFAMPENPVWIDTRFEMYPPEHWERYKAISDAAWNWEILLADEGINALLLSRETQASLILAVENSGYWVEAYSDERSVIFERRE